MYDQERDHVELTEDGQMDKGAQARLDTAGDNRPGTGHFSYNNPNDYRMGPGGPGSNYPGYGGPNNHDPNAINPNGNPYYGYHEGYGRNHYPGQQQRGNATASMVLGIVAAVLGLWLPLVGIVCGIIALMLASKSKTVGVTGGMVTAGFVLGIIGIVFGALSALVEVMSIFTWYWY